MSGVFWTAFAGFGAIFAAVSLPMLFGYGSLTVLSGSMEPTLHVGSVVVVQRIQPLDARVGDIVTYENPAEQGQLITHRIHDMTLDGAYVKFTTKGDANTGVEKWQVPPSGSIGRVVYRVPWIGYAMHWMRSRWGRLMLIVAPALALGCYELLGIWRPHSLAGSK